MLNFAANKFHMPNLDSAGVNFSNKTQFVAQYVAASGGYK